MKTCTFKGAVKIRGINPFVLVSATRADALRPGWRKPLPVLLRLNGKPDIAWKTNMMPAGDGSFYLYLNGPMRQQAEVSVGDQVLVEIAYDASYRNGPQHPMPALLRKALKENPAAWNNWVALIPSRQKEVLRYFAQLKSPEARERNVRTALQVLSGQSGRFMAIDWINGSPAVRSKDARERTLAKPSMIRSAIEDNYE